MKKQVKKAFGKTIYLLGQNAEGINYWLEEPSWNCDWYWGFGYIETYTNNKCPEKSKDINSHQHFDSLFLKGPSDGASQFKEFFKQTPLTDDEIYELVDYMRTFYTLSDTASLFRFGYSHYTHRAKLDELADINSCNLINKNYLPNLFERVKTLLSK